jgi:hypothetical protein
MTDDLSMFLIVFIISIVLCLLAGMFGAEDRPGFDERRPLA